MLVIVTGIESVGKPLIAKKISEKLNSFDQYKFNDYVINFSDDNLDIFDNTGKLVYERNGVHLLLHNEDGSLNEKGLNDLNQIFNFRQLISNTIFSTKNEFADVRIDLGFNKQEDIFVDYYPILRFYNNRKVDNVVIYGTFSKSILDHIFQLIGTDLKVLNIIRNPSTSFLLDTFNHTMPPVLPDSQFYNIVPIDPALSYAATPIVDSLIGSIGLMSFEYVTTVKYEDIIINQQFEFNGDTILLQDYINFNGILSKYDFEELIPNITDDKISWIDEFNKVFADMSLYYNFPTTTYHDLFTPFGYQPLSYNTIIQPPSDN